MQLDIILNATYNIYMNKGNPKIKESAHLGGKKTLELFGKNYFSELANKRWAKKKKKTLK